MTAHELKELQRPYEDKPSMWEWVGWLVVVAIVAIALTMCVCCRS